MIEAPQNVRFSYLLKICRHFCAATSHCVFMMPWPGDPRVNIQDDNGKTKSYQVRQVIEVIRRLRESIDGCE